MISNEYRVGDCVQLIHPPLKAHYNSGQKAKIIAVYNRYIDCMFYEHGTTHWIVTIEPEHTIPCENYEFKIPKKAPRPILTSGNAKGNIHHVRSETYRKKYGIMHGNSLKMMVMEHKINIEDISIDTGYSRHIIINSFNGKTTDIKFEHIRDSIYKIVDQKKKELERDTMTPLEALNNFCMKKCGTRECGNYSCNEYSVLERTIGLRNTSKPNVKEYACSDGNITGLEDTKE
ncbi:MAG: hypothetical protein HUJ53_04530 [Holdemanella sp.]|nr:hypothetical protein [Holdemanella sp.]